MVSPSNTCEQLLLMGIYCEASSELTGPPCVEHIFFETLLLSTCYIYEALVFHGGYQGLARFADPCPTLLVSSETALVSLPRVVIIHVSVSLGEL